MARETDPLDAIDANAIKKRLCAVTEKSRRRHHPLPLIKVKKPFPASHGWFRRKTWLHNLKLKGELASADSNAAQQYPAQLAEIIAININTTLLTKSLMLINQAYFGKSRHREPMCPKVIHQLVALQFIVHLFYCAATHLVI